MSFSVDAFNLALYVRHAFNTRRFRKRVGHWPNYVEPRTFNEKIQWRKLFDRNPLFPIFCDKLAARNYVAERTPSVRLPEILWVGRDPREIPYDSLPEQYVLKPNHRSGRNYFVRSEADVIPDLIVKKMRHSLRHPHGPRVREWGYQGVEGRIFAERMLETDAERDRTRDFRFHIFDGRTEVVVVELADVTTSKRAVLPYDVFYDRDWRQLPYRRFRKTQLSDAVAIPRPAHFDKLLAAAEKIGRAHV